MIYQGVDIYKEWEDKTKPVKTGEITKPEINYGDYAEKRIEELNQSVIKKFKILEEIGYTIFRRKEGKEIHNYVKEKGTFAFTIHICRKTPTMNLIFDYSQQEENINKFNIFFNGDGEYDEKICTQEIEIKELTAETIKNVEQELIKLYNDEIEKLKIK